MSKNGRLEDLILMPAGHKDASELEARVLREAKDVYDDVFGPAAEDTRKESEKDF